MKTTVSFLIIFFALLSQLRGACGVDLYVGPEIYHINRFREGGTTQSGRLDGVRVGFDRLKRYCWYVGADYLYATGKLKGETGIGSPQRSILTDQIVEIRFGYTLQQDDCRKSFFTPFGGWGHFQETNDFFPPSLLTCKFTDTFNYAVFGFLSGVNFTSLLSMGVNFKVRFMLDGESKVSNDPVMDDVTLQMHEETQYRLEVPFIYSPCTCLFQWQFVPFYEFRHFGGEEGFPFNFKDTKFNLFGARLALTYRF